MSAMAPAGSVTTTSGSIIALCTSATISAELVSLVISQAAPTPRKSWPKLENRLAVQIRRNVPSRKGAKAPPGEPCSGDEAPSSPFGALLCDTLFPFVLPLGS